MMNRREMLFSVAGGLCASCLNPSRVLAQTAPGRTGLGIAQFSYANRLRAERASQQETLADPLKFLEHCHGVGAGGMQVDLGIRDDAYTRKLRDKAQAYDMFIEGSASLPRDRSAVDRFANALRTAKRAGVRVVRIAIGGRRYEQFDRLEQFQAFAERSFKSLQLAESVAARHQLRLAVENHKDWRIDQMLDMLKRLSSEYMGVCVDTGNSIALLENPLEVVQAYAPWAHSVHLKDMALCEYPEGFLLADVVIGQGILDLPRMVEILRRAKPEIQFTLEMATRDPLKVPCLTAKYWATLTQVPGSDLASILRYVRTHAQAEGSLPRVGHLSTADRVRREAQDIKACLAYASQGLKL
jgi:sugar phosphate isomerase/epimerase